VTLTSRLGNDVTAGYPELAGLGPALRDRAAVLDGQIVTFDSQGRPSSATGRPGRCGGQEAGHLVDDGLEPPQVTAKLLELLQEGHGRLPVEAGDDVRGEHHG